MNHDKIYVMKYLFLVMFIVSTGVHLYASLKQDKKLRNYTKPFLITSLLGFYVLSSKDIRTVTILALIFSWIGDLWLMIPGVKYFAIGGVSFMISHIFFVFSYIYDIVFANVNKIIVVILAIFFVITVSIIFSHLKKHLPTKLFYPMYLYLLINGTMNCFAIFRMLSNVTTSTIITCVGAILFFISDSALFFVRFQKNCKLKTHFLVMLTYSIGELLIIIGLL